MFKVIMAFVARASCVALHWGGLCTVFMHTAPKGTTYCAFVPFCCCCRLYTFSSPSACRTFQLLPSFSPGFGSSHSPMGTSYGSQSTPEYQQQQAADKAKRLEEFVMRVRVDKQGDGCMLACRACHRYFKSVTGLHRHVRKVHMDDPTYRCEQCGSGFMTREHWTGHMNMHTGVQSFQCPHCPQKFTYKGDLYRHKKTCSGLRNRN